MARRAKPHDPPFLRTVCTQPAAPRPQLVRFHFWQVMSRERSYHHKVHKLLVPSIAALPRSGYAQMPGSQPHHDRTSQRPPMCGSQFSHPHTRCESRLRQVWAQSKRPLTSSPNPQAQSPDSRVVASGSRGRSWKLLDMVSGPQRLALPHSDWLTIDRLTCWVCGRNPSTLELRRAQAH